jgi:ferrochelatase
MLKQRYKLGNKKLLVFCPAFIADCLETTVEISDEYAEEFEHLGGEKLQLVEGLNDHPIWIDAVCDIVRS